MKKSALCLTILLLVTMVFSTMVSCTSQGEDYQVKNPTQAPTVYTYDPNWTPMPAPTDANGKEVTGNPYEYVNPERLFNKGEWMDMCGMQFRFNSVKFTKAIDGIDPEKIDAFNIARSNYGKMVDAAGNLYGNCSYVVMNVDAKNVTNKAIISTLSFQLVEHVKDVNRPVAHFVYKESNKELEKDTTTENYVVQPNDEVNITLYGWMNDYYIDNEMLYLYIPNYAVETVPDVEGAFYQYSLWMPMNQDKSKIDIYSDYKDLNNYINSERLYNIGETAEIKEMTFRVNGVTMGKSLDGITKDNVRYEDYEKTIIDSAGTFISDSEYSRIYIKANITIKNLAEKEIDLCIGSIYLSNVHSVAGIVFRGAEGVTPSMTTDLTYDDFYRFQPGEEVTFDIYYIVHDRYLTDDTLMIHFPLNMGLQDTENLESSYDYDVFIPIKKDKGKVNNYGK